LSGSLIHDLNKWKLEIIFVYMEILFGNLAQLNKCIKFPFTFSYDLYNKDS